ncbi:MAG TPA: hypothetical protein VHN55_08550 [Sphingomicrobium sp.]|nr:hypothetical protein [Sphingomicrobium sp.]
MKRAIIAAVALVSTSLTSTITSPAWASDGDDDVILTPVNLDGDYDAQAICDEALRPNPNSGFLTEPTNVSDTGWVNDGDPVRDQNVGDPVPTGTPTASFVIIEGGYHRHGGSPNVWGRGNATLTYPNSTQEYTTVQNLVRTVTVDCHVWKVVPGNGNIIEPPGLQTTGNTATDHDSTAGENGFDTNNGPVTLTGQEVDALICISPGKKGGAWTGKNGFAAASCAAASQSAGEEFLPSGNIPQI